MCKKWGDIAQGIPVINQHDWHRYSHICAILEVSRFSPVEDDCTQVYINFVWETTA